jgi:hypothetical protein
MVGFPNAMFGLTVMRCNNSCSFIAMPSTVVACKRL